MNYLCNLDESYLKQRSFIVDLLRNIFDYSKSHSDRTFFMKNFFKAATPNECIEILDKLTSSQLQIKDATEYLCDEVIWHYPIMNKILDTYIFAEEINSYVEGLDSSYLNKHYLKEDTFTSLPYTLKNKEALKLFSDEFQSTFIEYFENYCLDDLYNNFKAFKISHKSIDDYINMNYGPNNLDLISHKDTLIDTLIKLSLSSSGSYNPYTPLFFFDFIVIKNQPDSEYNYNVLIILDNSNRGKDDEIMYDVKSICQNILFATNEFYKKCFQ